MAEEESNGLALLDKVYGYVLDGVPTISEPVDTLVEDYTSQYGYTEKAIEKFISNQVKKCATTGFLTGLGGLITLPVTLPADLVSALYMDVRMIAGIAKMRGYDIHSDEVKTLVYLCIAVDAVKNVLEDVGIACCQKYAAKVLLPKLSKEIIIKINKAVGFRLLTKGGTKGLINISKLIPLIGGIFGAAFNVIETKYYAGKAKEMFEKQ